MTWIHRVETFDGRILAVVKSGQCPFCSEPAKHSHEIPAVYDLPVGPPVAVLAAVELSWLRPQEKERV